MRKMRLFVAGLQIPVSRAEFDTLLAVESGTAQGKLSGVLYLQRRGLVQGGNYPYRLTSSGKEALRNHRKVSDA